MKRKVYATETASITFPTIIKVLFPFQSYSFPHFIEDRLTK